MSIDPAPPKYPLPKYEFDPPPGCLVLLAILLVAVATGATVGWWRDSSQAGIVTFVVVEILGIIMAVLTGFLSSEPGCQTILMTALAFGGASATKGCDSAAENKAKQTVPTPTQVAP